MSKLVYRLLIVVVHLCFENLCKISVSAELKMLFNISPIRADLVNKSLLL